VLLSSCLSWALADEAEDEKVVGSRLASLAWAPQLGPTAAVSSVSFTDNTFNSAVVWRHLRPLRIPSLLIRTKAASLTFPHTTDFFQEASPTPRQ
jgi:hypothetical protein